MMTRRKLESQREYYQRNKENIRQWHLKNYQENKESIKLRQNQYRARRRMDAIAIMGGECEMCRFEASTREELNLFVFHHLLTNTKKRWSINVVNDILSGKMKNIQLLCANCHVLANIRDGTHGTWTTFLEESGL